MKVELMIADDHELRAAIKDLIKTEVVSIARSEIKTILAQVISEKVLPSSQDDIDRLMHAVLYDYVRSVVGSTLWGAPTMVKDMVLAEVKAYLRELWSRKPPMENAP